MRFLPRLRSGTTDTVKALTDHLANNGPIRLLIKFGVGRPRPYDVVDIRIIEWADGVEAFAVFRPSTAAADDTGVEQHITLDQPMLDSLARQCGIERGA